MTVIYQECKRHGLTAFGKRGIKYKCKRCATEDKRRGRKKAKHKLVEIFGGRCSICGYNKCAAVLQFHHLRPSQKLFDISSRNDPSFDRLLAEARKCILVCANCHGEIENGVIDMKKNLFLNSIDTSVENLLYYDRKGDQELTYEDVEQLINNGEVTLEEMKEAFAKAVKEKYPSIQ